jgi:predicted transcriptional regulator
MSQTITVRLSKDLAAWLEHVAAKTGVPQGKIVRDQLERARASSREQAFMRLAGVVRGPRDLSRRKGFSRS